MKETVVRRHRIRYHGLVFGTTHLIVGLALTLASVRRSAPSRERQMRVDKQMRVLTFNLE